MRKRLSAPVLARSDTNSNEDADNAQLCRTPCERQRLVWMQSDVSSAAATELLIAGKELGL